MPATTRKSNGVARIGNKNGDNPRAARSGFTLVELLVVIAIIGILVALLLPAVNSARESARRIQCVNNLKQIGLACQNYHSALGTLPPGSVATGPDNRPENVRSNWMIEILPYIEEQATHDRYDFEVHNAHMNNRPILKSIISSYLCPTDPKGEQLSRPGQDGGLSGALNDTIAPSSYKGVAGMLRFSSPIYWDRSLTINQLKRFNFSRGPLHIVQDGVVKPESFRKIKDGTSKTILAGEYMTITNDSRRSFWASSWRNHNLGMTVKESWNRIADYDRCVELGGSVFVCRRSFASLHPGGINFALCDGSVQTVPADVDGQIFEAMATVHNDRIAEPRYNF